MEALGSVLAQYVVIIGGLAAAYWGIVRWLRRVAGASERAEANLRTSNANTTGQLVEANHKQLVELRRELDVLASWTGQNRDGWQRALNVAERAAAMIDAHLAGHGTEREG